MTSTYMRDFLLIGMGVLGTTITPWGQFFISSFAFDKNIEKGKINYSQFETYWGRVPDGFLLVLYDCCNGGPRNVAGSPSHSCGRFCPSRSLVCRTWRPATDRRPAQTPPGGAAARTAGEARRQQGGQRKHDGLAFLQDSPLSHVADRDRPGCPGSIAHDRRGPGIFDCLSWPWPRKPFLPAAVPAKPSVIATRHTGSCTGIAGRAYFRF